MTPARFPACQDWDTLLRSASLWPGLLHTGASPESVARVGSGLRYLATPYSRLVRDPRSGQWSRVRSEEMVRHAALHAADLAGCGVTAVSPIVQSGVMCHGASVLDPLDEAFWGRWCQPLLEACTAVVVPDIPGWRQSLGVWREVVWALDRNRPVHVYGGRA